MKRSTLAIATALMGAILIVATIESQAGWLTSGRARQALLMTLGGVLVVAGVVSWLASRGPVAAADVLPLNWFLPVLRKPSAGEAVTEGLLIRGARRLLPAACFSDRTTKRRGLIRRGLRRLGVSWLSAPARRLAQAVSFAIFLSLFFWVCWPYSARPEAPGKLSVGWRLLEIGATDGLLTFAADFVPAWMVADKAVYLVDTGSTGAEEAYFLQAAVARVADQHVSLRPQQELNDQQLDQLLTNDGPWTMHERQPGAWPVHYANNLARKEFLPVDLFLVIDPLVSLSTAIASRSWVWSLICAATIFTVCLLIPRGFCGYVCPLGTLIDLFDATLGRRVTRFRLPADGWWVHIKYYLLLGTLVAALCGVLVSGYVAAIPVITRGMLFLGEPLQSGAARGWHLVTPMHVGHVASLVLFIAVLGLGLLRPRFWCKYVCPSGATFSLANLFRVSERKVESTCIHCNKCIEVCPFDAIKPDFTTRVTDCTLCQTCGGVCPTHAIKFVERWNGVQLKVAGDPPTGETSIGRRGVLSLAAGTVAALVGGVGVAAATAAWGAKLDDPRSVRPVRPPGSVPERKFLQLCIRCGECFKVCPNNVLQAEGFQQGLEGLWAPMVVADWAGCESSCNACGQVCPTGAIRALPMEEKRVVRMGLAIVNQTTCLPLANREACQLCVDECNAAGYRAIEFVKVHTLVDEAGNPVETSGYLAPAVIAETCVGCGLCQTRCYAINVKQRHVLRESAIVIEAGPGREDRLVSGSYMRLRREEEARRNVQRRSTTDRPEFFVPRFDADERPRPQGEGGPDDPF